MTEWQIISLCVLLVGSTWTFGTWRARQLGSDSAYWPVTRGEIIESGVTVETTRDRNGRANTLFGVAVSYRFQLGRTFHESTRITWANDRKARLVKPLRRILARYPVGRMVDVYYDPKRPGEAVLEPRNQAIMRLAPVVSVAFLIIGSAGLIVASV